MKETNFRLIKIESRRGTDEVLWLRASYDFVGGMLKDRPARLEVGYTLGNRPQLKSVSLDMHYLIPTPKSIVYFEDNKPTRMETWNPYPSMIEPRDLSRKVGEDHLKRNTNYRAMVELIPDGEPIKPVLENLVR